MEKDFDPLVDIFSDIIPNMKLVLFIVPIMIFIITFFIPTSYSGLLPLHPSSLLNSQQKWLSDAIGIYYFLITLYILMKYILTGIYIKLKRRITQHYKKKLQFGEITPINHPKLMAFFLMVLVFLNIVATFFFADPQLEKFATIYASIHSSAFGYFLFNLAINNLMLLLLIMSIYYLEIEN